MKITKSLLLLFCFSLTDVFGVAQYQEPSIKFDKESGFYNENISLGISVSTYDEGAVIYYTLDGSIPNESSYRYRSPIYLTNKSYDANVHSNHLNISPNNDFRPAGLVNKGNIVRAIAKLSNGEFTDVKSGTFFVGLNRNKLYEGVPVISIITDPYNLFDDENGMYVMGNDYKRWIAENPDNANLPNHLIKGNYDRSGKKAEKPATIEYIPAGENIASLYQDVGIRMKGNTTRTYYQKSFHVSAREEYGKKNIKYKLIPNNKRSDGNGEVEKYKHFGLRNGGNDSEFSKIRDMVLQELIKNNFFETQQSQLAVVFIDGEYWGIYGIYEEYNDNYIGNNYDIDNKNVVVIKSKKVESGEDEDLNLFENMMNFILKNDMSIESNYEKAKKQFDVEGYAWYAAFYIYNDVIDGWFQDNNWAMWRARDPDSSTSKADGKWRIMMFDTEYSTGLYGEGEDYDKNTIESVFSETDYDSVKMTNSLLKNENFKTMFINALCDMRNINYNLNRVEKTINKYKDIISPLVKEHILRNGPSWANPDEHTNEQIGRFRTWLNGRYSVFLNYIQDYFKFNPYVKIVVTSNNFNKGSILINNMNEFKESYTGRYFKENILYIKGKPAKGKKIKSWVLNGCKVANKSKNVIGVYAKKSKCTVTVNFK